jgi:hypothetical protein
VSWRLVVKARDLKTVFAVTVGLAGAGLVWLAAQISYEQYLCMSKKTLLVVGGGLGVFARFAGMLFRFRVKVEREAP